MCRGKISPGEQSSRRRSGHAGYSGIAEAGESERGEETAERERNVYGAVKTVS